MKGRRRARFVGTGGNRGERAERLMTETEWRAWLVGTYNASPDKQIGRGLVMCYDRGHVPWPHRHEIWTPK